MKEALKKLLAQRTAKHEAMQALLDLATTEERSLTKEEGEKYDALTAEYDALTADVERMDAQIQREHDLSQPQRAALVGDPGAGSKPKGEDNPADIDVDMSRYSLMRAVNALRTGDFKGAEYERECSVAIADKLGREAQGLFIPYAVQRAVMATQAGAGFTNAGALVGTDHMADLFIESLKAESFVVSSGARVLTDLVGDVDIPRSLGGVTFNWLGEDEDASDSTASLDTVQLSPKTVAGAVPITRRLIKQSSPAVEQMIYDDIRQGIALAIDTAVLAADGTANQPTGILHTTGVNTQSVADGTNGVPTFTELVGFETQLLEDNALGTNPLYVTTPSIAQSLKTTAKDAGSGIMLYQDGKANGYAVRATTLMPAKKMLFGNFSDIVIGMWGVMDITVDTATKAASGGTVLRVFQDVDIAIRHPQSFCVTA